MRRQLHLIVKPKWVKLIIKKKPSSGCGVKRLPSFESTWHIEDFFV